MSTSLLHRVVQGTKTKWAAVTRGDDWGFIGAKANVQRLRTWGA